MGITAAELRYLEAYIHRKAGQIIQLPMSDTESEWIREAPWHVAPKAEYRMSNYLRIGLDGEGNLVSNPMAPYRHVYRPILISIVSMHDYEDCSACVDFLHEYEQATYPRMLYPIFDGQKKGTP